MTVTDTFLTIERMHIFAHHGVLDQERTVGNEFEVTVILHYNAESAVDTDSLREAVPYDRVAELIKAEMARPSALLEHVCGRIARAVCTAYPRITSGTVTVTKLKPPMPVQSAGASFTLSFTR